MKKDSTAIIDLATKVYRAIIKKTLFGMACDIHGLRAHARAGTEFCLFCPHALAEELNLPVEDVLKALRCLWVAGGVEKAERGYYRLAPKGVPRDRETPIFTLLYSEGQKEESTPITNAQGAQK
jgi:hypothetical protein